MLHPSAVRYLVASEQRSGTTFLCDLLRSMEIAGKPEEHFQHRHVAENAVAWGAHDYSHYINEAVQNLAGNNGVFGAKITWHQFGSIMKELEQRAGHELTPLELGSLFGGNLRFIWLRRDPVEQGVSLVRAQQEDRWSEHERVNQEPSYSFRLIHRAVQQLQAADFGWHTWFNR
jgi:trehalose 2-sulfotransferase